MDPDVGSPGLVQVPVRHFGVHYLEAHVLFRSLQRAVAAHISKGGPIRYICAVCSEAGITAIGSLIEEKTVNIHLENRDICMPQNWFFKQCEVHCIIRVVHIPQHRLADIILVQSSLVHGFHFGL